MRDPVFHFTDALYNLWHSFSQPWLGCLSTKLLPLFKFIVITMTCSSFFPKMGKAPVTDQIIWETSLGNWLLVAIWGRWKLTSWVNYIQISEWANGCMMPQNCAQMLKCNGMEQNATRKEFQENARNFSISDESGNITKVHKLKIRKNVWFFWITPL